MELGWSLNVWVPCLRMPQTPDIFSVADAAWKHPKYPCFCILSLEFVVNIDIQNMKTVKFYVQPAINHHMKCLGTTDCKYMENMSMDFIWLNAQAKYLISFNVTLNEIWLFESDPNAPSTWSERGGKQWQRSIRGRRNWDVELGPCAVIRHLCSVAFVWETKRPQADNSRSLIDRQVSCIEMPCHPRPLVSHGKTLYEMQCNYSLHWEVMF